MPAIIENFDKMPEDEQKSVSYLANFFCGLHALIHIAETAEKAIGEAEQGLLSTPQADEGGGKTNEARTCCKAFAAGADEKSGVYGHFRILAKEFRHRHHLHSLPIVPFRGSRFNILFDNAAGTFFLREQMLQFLQQFGAENLFYQGCFV